MHKANAARSLRGIVLCLALASPALAGSSAEARAWLEKMAQAGQQGQPFRVQYSMKMQVPPTEETPGGGSLDMNGTVTQADQEHVRMQMVMRIQSGGMAEPLAISMLGVADGETMWLEMDNPVMGGRYVMKLDLKTARQLGDRNPLGQGGQMGPVDPLGQVKQIVELFDFELVGVEDGQVTLKARPTTAGAEKLEQLPDDVQSEGLTLILDEKSGFPLEMTMGGADPFLVMKFSDLEFVTAEDLGTDVFRYTPPEGLPVLDLGELLESPEQETTPEP